jgi:hypothetical protein
MISMDNGTVTGQPLPRPPADEVWLLAVHPALTADLVAWLQGRGLQLGRVPAEDAGGDQVWVTSPTDELLQAVDEHLADAGDEEG